MSKTHLIIFAISVLVIFGLFLLWQGGQTERVVEPAVVENETYSLSFDYLAGEDGYELIESGTQDNVLQSYVLVDQAELLEYRENEEETAPPTMSVFVFRLPEEETEGEEGAGRITRLQNWAQANSGLTSFEAIYGTPEIVEVDGVKALEYSTDGIYQQSIFLVSYRGYIYMFVGQYDRPTDFIKQDFENLMQTVRIG